MIASYDTVVSHSPCKLRVSIHKNKIEAGNWLSRGEERERTERWAVSIRGKPVLQCSHSGRTQPGAGPAQKHLASASLPLPALPCPALGNADDLVPGRVTPWGRDGVSRNLREVRAGLRKACEESQDHSRAASLEIVCVCACVRAHVYTCVHVRVYFQSRSSYLPWERFWALGWNQGGCRSLPAGYLFAYFPFPSTESLWFIIITSHLSI